MSQNLKILPVFLILLLFGFNHAVTAQKKSDTIPGYYPPFSWDKVPVYIHSGNNMGLSDEEVEFIATHCDFYCFEKNHGLNTHGSAEAGHEFDAQRIKAINPDIHLVYYWNTFLDYPFTLAHEVYQDHPEWWLYYQDGTLDLKAGKHKRYDLSNPEVREWWAEEVRKAVTLGSCDGVFMDAFPQIASEGNIPLWGQEKYDSIQDGLIELIKLTRAKTDSSAMLMYNGVRNTDDLEFGMEYLDLCDAAAIEHFDQFASTSKESIQRDLEAVMEAGRRGKIIILKTFPGFNWTQGEKMAEPYEDLLEESRQNITFPLACFLVAAQPYSYFNYSWGYRAEFGTLEWYDELDRPLGEPLGDAVQDGWEYTREFEHVRVWVNIETKEARIEWEGYTPLYSPPDSTVLDRSPTEMSDSLMFSFIPSYQSDSIPDYSGNTTFTTEYQPSGSEWHEQCNEEDVYLARLSHKLDQDSLLWDLRIGKAGAIYSFIGPYGEGVPPQWRPWEFNTARWADDLWQTVALSQEFHNADIFDAPPGSTLGRPQVPSMRYFIHGAGVYMNDTMFARTNQPFYSPLMAAWYDNKQKALHTMNWGQQAHIPSIHKSQLLYSYKYKDLGNGILEATHIIQNFGDHKVDYLNMPWGGVRAGNLPQCWLSKPDHSLERKYELFGGTGEQGILNSIDESGGYFIWSADGVDENRPAMAIVFGKDIHYDDFRYSHNMLPTRIRWGDGSADINRSYSVFTVNPRIDINPGNSFFYRVFYINGTMKEVHDKARRLVNSTNYGFIEVNSGEAPTTLIRKESLDSAFTHDIKLFASPVDHMVPLFLMENTETGKQFISPDLYLNANTLPFTNPYDPADPEYDTYQDRIVYRHYTGNIKYIRLLGYGVNRDHAFTGIRFALLDSLVKDTTRVIPGGKYKNKVWIPVEACDTCNASPEPEPEPEPGFMLYNDFGDYQPFPWTGPVNMSFTDKVPNPDSSLVNSSPLTGKVVRESGKWAHIHFNLPETLDLTTYSTFKVKAYYQGSDPVPDICKVRLILRNNGNGLTQYSLEKQVDVANRWIEYTFNCEGALGKDDYNQVWLFFSSPDDDNMAIGHTYYIDDLIGPPVRIPENYTVKFSVSSEDSGSKLGGITVSINNQEKQTDLTGEVDFTLLEGSHNYSINTIGYFPVESSLDLVNDTVLKIRLIESSANLKFRVYANDLPLNGAEVILNDNKLFTNQVGIVLYEDLQKLEEYVYRIQKQGFEPDSGVVNLITDTTVNVILLPEVSTGENPEKRSLKIYPIPVSSILHIDSEVTITKLEIFSLAGNLVFVTDPESHSAGIDLSEMDAGLYILKVHFANESPVMDYIIISR